MYYSYHKINNRDQKIVATEQEAFAGDKPWDLNPMVWFRVKNPIQSLDALPLIELSKLFTQATEPDQVSFTIKNRLIDSAVVDAVEIADQEVLNRFETVKNFTEE